MLLPVHCKYTIVIVLYRSWIYLSLDIIHPFAQAIKNALHNYFLPQVKLHEFYIVDVDTMVEEFRRRISSTMPSTMTTTEEVSKNRLVIIQDPQYGRKTCTVDMNIAVRLYNLPK